MADASAFSPSVLIEARAMGGLHFCIPPKLSNPGDRCRLIAIEIGSHVSTPLAARRASKSWLKIRAERHRAIVATL
jgi:hypothetical protein